MSVNGVSCVAVKSCVVLGSAFSTDGNTVQLIWTWNGSKWGIKAASFSGSAQGATLTAVHCFSLTSCVVTGNFDTITSRGTSTTITFNLLFATWNGKAFTAQQAAVPSGLSFGSITDLSCVSQQSCASAGLGLSGSLTSTNVKVFGFIEVWNGKA
jgi:hypothetical protein